MTISRSLRLSEGEMKAAEIRERLELARQTARLRGDRPREELFGRTAIVVDDGLATGATARAACAIARREGASRGGRIAESAAEIEAARSLVLATAWSIEQEGFRAARERVSMIKYYTANVMQRVVDRALQGHDGLGVDGGHGNVVGPEVHLAVVDVIQRIDQPRGGIGHVRSDSIPTHIAIMPPRFLSDQPPPAHHLADGDHHHGQPINFHA